MQEDAGREHASPSVYFLNNCIFRRTIILAGLKIDKPNITIWLNFSNRISILIRDINWVLFSDQAINQFLLPIWKPGAPFVASKGIAFCFSNLKFNIMGTAFPISNPFCWPLHLPINLLASVCPLCTWPVQPEAKRAKDETSAIRAKILLIISGSTFDAQF